MEEERQMCNVCHKSLKITTNMAVHMRTHSPLRPFSCKLCGKDFNFKGNLDRHMRFHLGHKPYKCDKCDKGFVTSSDLVRHGKVHTAGGISPTMISTASFNPPKKRPGRPPRLVPLLLPPDPAALRPVTPPPPVTTKLKSPTIIESPRKQRHSPSPSLVVSRKPPPFVHCCDICDRLFKNQTSLLQHRKRHEAVNPFQCPICGLTYATKQNVERHLKTHAGLKPYICDYCERTFTQRSDLIRHTKKFHHFEYEYRVYHEILDSIIDQIEENEAEETNEK